MSIKKVSVMRLINDVTNQPTDQPVGHNTCYRLGYLNHYADM